MIVYFSTLFIIGVIFHSTGSNTVRINNETYLENEVYTGCSPDMIQSQIDVEN